MSGIKQLEGKTCLITGATNGLDALSYVRRVQPVEMDDQVTS
jgi:hypothetical protein